MYNIITMKNNTTHADGTTEILSNATLELLAYATSNHCAGRYDNGGRWFASDPVVAQWCNDNLRTPSRAFPQSYLRGLSTLKANVHFGYITELQANLCRKFSRLETKSTALETTAHDLAKIALDIQKLEKDYSAVITQRIK